MHLDDIKEMQDSVEEFIKLYKTRPIINNKGGMGFNHSWATWYLVKKIQPNLIVESGVHKGHSTWLLEKASPKSKLISFDINLSNKSFHSDKATYVQSDFFSYNWSNFELSDSLVFFDDHQNQYERLIRSFWLGFKRIIFEDVWPVGEGDCYSMKHLLAGSGAPNIQMSKSFKGGAITQTKRRIAEEILKRRKHSQFQIIDPNNFDLSNLKKRTKLMIEMPPVFLEEFNIWGLPYEGAYKTRTPLRHVKPMSDVDYSYYYLTYIELT